jgi:hypothetical protein
MEEAEALGARAFSKHPFFACPHYCAADLQSCLLLGVAGADIVCERGCHKACYEKDKCDYYQQE